VVPLCPDRGNLRESARGLSLLAFIWADSVKETGEPVALQDQFLDILWAKA